MHKKYLILFRTESGQDSFYIWKEVDHEQDAIIEWGKCQRMTNCAEAPLIVRVLKPIVRIEE